MTDLRDRIAEALTREHHRRAAERIEASPEEHQAAFADAVMAEVQPVLDQQAAETRRCFEADHEGRLHHWQHRAEAAEDENRKLAGLVRDLARAEIDLKRENEQLREQVRQYGGLAEQHQQIGDLR